MPKVNCAVINYWNFTYKLKKFVMSITTLTVAVNDKTAFLVYHHSKYTAFQAYGRTQS